MRGLLVLLIVVIIGILAYSTGLFGLASGKITLAHLFNETITVSSSAQATVYREVTLPEPGLVNITVISGNPVSVNVINGTKTVDLGYGERVSAELNLARDFVLVIKDLNSTATVYVVEQY